MYSWVLPAPAEYRLPASQMNFWPREGPASHIRPLITLIRASRVRLGPTSFMAWMATLAPNHWPWVTWWARPLLLGAYLDPASRSAVRTVVNRHYVEFLRPLLDDARSSGQL